jgi:hypothetical protein
VQEHGNLPGPHARGDRPAHDPRDLHGLERLAGGGEDGDGVVEGHAVGGFRGAGGARLEEARLQSRERGGRRRRLLFLHPPRRGEPRGDGSGPPLVARGRGGEAASPQAHDRHRVRAGQLLQEAGRGRRRVAGVGEHHAADRRARQRLARRAVQPGPVDEALGPQALGEAAAEPGEEREPRGVDGRRGLQPLGRDLGRGQVLQRAQGGRAEAAQRGGLAQVGRRALGLHRLGGRREEQREVDVLRHAAAALGEEARRGDAPRELGQQREVDRQVAGVGEEPGREPGAEEVRRDDHGHRPQRLAPAHRADGRLDETHAAATHADVYGRKPAPRHEASGPARGAWGSSPAGGYRARTISGASRGGPLRGELVSPTSMY